MSALIAAHEILPRENYLKLAEDYFSKIEGKFLKKQDSTQLFFRRSFLEDYAFLINALNDLSDKTMNLNIKIMLQFMQRSIFKILY